MFKSLQKVATTVSLRNEKGHPIKIGSHLTVIKQDGDTVIMRQAKKVGQVGKAFRVTATPDQLATTFAGRPSGSKNKVKVGAAV